MEDSKPKVFIVHGSDEITKTQAEALIPRIGMEPIVLHRRPDQGQTIIEKFEGESDVSFAIVLLTPDDEGRKKGEPNLRSRARQNVVFELGYFFAKLGREKVICITKGDIERPSDIDGIIYMNIKESLDEIEGDIKKEFTITEHQKTKIKPIDIPTNTKDAVIISTAEVTAIAQRFTNHMYDRKYSTITIRINDYLEWASNPDLGYDDLDEEYDLFLAVAKIIHKKCSYFEKPDFTRETFARTINRAKRKIEERLRAP